MSAEEQGQTAGIPVDENDGFDADSTFEEDVTAESTTSLNESILLYRTLHGRRYHNFKSAEYWGPNDESQNDQLDIGHHMLTLLLEGKLFLAPIGDHPQNVIDVGTGTGIWAMYGSLGETTLLPSRLLAARDFADNYPSARVIGTDLSDIQPRWVPPNCIFELDDAQLEWTYPHNHFDFVHLRCLMGSIKDWPMVYDEIFKCMKPGGYIEHMEMDIEFKSDDGSVGEGHIMRQWSKTFIDCGDKELGRTFKIGQRSKGYLEAAGFVNLVEKKFKVPVGSWPSDQKLKLIGQYNLLYCIQGLEGWALWILTTILGWSYEDIQVFIAQMRTAMLKKSNHSYYDIIVVYGQKAEAPAMED